MRHCVPKRDDSHRPSDKISVELKGGFTVTLDVVADWTKLETTDRDFVIELIDKMRGYSNA